MTFATFVRKQASDFLDYDTPKFVHIRSKKIGALCRVTQLLCLGYVVGYDLLYEKGYQMSDVGVSGVTTKVKGLQFSGDANSRLPDSAVLTWDPADYVVPPQMGRCSEDPTLRDARCKGDGDCPAGRTAGGGNGAFTGKCLVGDIANDSAMGNRSAVTAALSGVCEVSAWCPVENDTLTSNVAALRGSRNATVLIKNYVHFPYYEKHRSNIMETATKDYLRSCVYNAQTDPQCPIFRLGDVVDSIKGESYDRLALIGGVVSIRIDWDCNLDYSIKLCKPAYSFARLDSEATDALVAQGYNFRFTYNYWEGALQRRMLVKAYGILFLVTVTAKAGAFHVIPLMMKVGSGLGLLSVATVVCDFAVANFYRKRHVIKQKKFDGLDRRNASFCVAAAGTPAGERVAADVIAASSADAQKAPASR